MPGMSTDLSVFLSPDISIPGIVLVLPAGIQISVRQTNPVVIIERDTPGNEPGGIRFPRFDVPVAMNSGKNAGGSFCRYYGTQKAFDPSTLKKLHPTHQAYMKRFKESVQDNLKAGYILEADTAGMLNEAMRLSYLWE